MQILSTSKLLKTVTQLDFEVTHIRVTQKSLREETPLSDKPLLWLPYVIGQAIIFLPHGFFLSIFFYLLSFLA